MAEGEHALRTIAATAMATFTAISAICWTWVIPTMTADLSHRIALKEEETRKIQCEIY